MFYAYIYRDPRKNNEPFYVGKGSNKRVNRHKYGCGHNQEMNNKIKKMLREGVEPFVEMINAIDENHAFFLETCLISMIGRKDKSKGPLLNHTDGGEGVSGIIKVVAEETKRKVSQSLLGFKHSEIAKKRMSDSQKGLKAGSKHPMFAKEVTVEMRLKYSEAAKGKFWWNDGVKSVLSKVSPGINFVPGRTPFTRSAKC